MEEEIENPPRVSRKNGAHPRNTEREMDDGGDRAEIECSGRSCRSCTAALIADCVALCCCPCAVINFLAFAFVKVPWAVGRRCLGLGKKRRKRRETKRKKSSKKGGRDQYQNDSGTCVVERWWAEEVEGIMENSSPADEERVWLELYQVGHLGFGRVSFTGIQSQSKSN
ncbi:Transmembrane protein [Trema orientale]|uniref:Transmembrane protein n=1 Tax=Trema orientale TaxID=63057 RepID=A0A2P5A9D6_TREOI|nr:Transmembrane protein [Trema orientale]